MPGSESVLVSALVSKLPLALNPEIESLSELARVQEWAQARELEQAAASVLVLERVPVLEQGRPADPLRRELPQGQLHRHHPPRADCPEPCSRESP